MKHYVGRFAPSPSGDLHFGSLIAALGSFLHARAAKGEWLVRIEDIDPPRESPGAASRILKTLEHYGLTWDRNVLYQSDRHLAYSEILQHCIEQQWTYPCRCQRQMIQRQGGHLRSICQPGVAQPSAAPAALRFLQTHPTYYFDDLHYGQVKVEPTFAEEDFVLFRKDGLFAYHLAVVVDDHQQGVTHIVRGGDLLMTTSWHISFYQKLGWAVPKYLHLPLALGELGNKLSKQNHAPPLSHKNIVPTLAHALQFLGQPLPENWQDAQIETLLDYAITHWNSALIPLQDKQMIQK